MIWIYSEKVVINSVHKKNQ